ncbi:HDOD domain-containing protein [Niveibacterium umoris]|uniref:HD-like signal output (HDOD) protein n=1 Tax=Niveibacterium umoris TaxID=1193620 RepID=A0A840BD58_9RHOO|nr:HDOD domain-containing protein [Niveibacterium umoris]MBB4011025.1 HD-like signal output (HDOD) protein [Niveibacterium umoris]
MSPDQTAAIDGMLGEAIRDIGIPPRPRILDSISAEMLKENPDFNRLATLISSDVSLAAGLMKTANSPYFGFRFRARTVSQALMMLGLDVSSRAVAGLILRKVFISVPALERFWDASARIAMVSGWLTQQLGNRNGVRAEEAYTFGLFRDCGIPVLMRKFADYTTTLKLANDAVEARFTDVEETRHPTNHAIVGCLLAQSWWMPEETCLAIRYHHDSVALTLNIGGLPPASQRLIAIVQLAEFLFQTSTGLSPTREWGKLGEACLRLLDVNEEGLAGLVEDARAFLDSVEA